MRVALYARISTPDQSTERQIHKLRNYARSRGWKIIKELQDVVSGISQKRPQHEQIIEMARRRSIYRVDKGLSLITEGKTYQEAALKTGISVSTLSCARQNVET
jgi:DNA invertase Pin-like site-specific DNA recombinase